MTFLLEFWTSTKKKCQYAFPAKTMQLFYNQQFPIKDFWDLGVWGF